MINIELTSFKKSCLIWDKIESLFLLPSGDFPEQAIDMFNAVPTRHTIDISYKVDVPHD